MNGLLLPFVCSLRNRFFPGGRPSLRTGLVIAFGLGLFVALYLVSLKVVGYFHKQSDLGIILSLKIFQMAWVIFFFMLIFSSMVSGVSSLFLSSDNDIYYSAPVSHSRLFLMRYLTTTFYTSWMMAVFSLPVFGAFGTVFRAGPLYWLLLVPAICSIALISSGLGLTATILLVNLFPARRTKDIVFYLSMLFGILLYLVFRLIRPEELADPEKFPDFVEYLSALSTPATPFLPPSWASNMLTTFLRDHQVDLLLTGLLLITPPVCYFAGEWVMNRYFFQGFSKAQESFGGSRRFRRLRYTTSFFVWLLRKEIRMFLRDSAEWSQLFLVGALVVVYLYNFKVLPLDRSPIPAEFVANMIAFANIGLTGFMIASLSARFVYPSIATEGSGFDLIRTAPVSIRRYLLYKYLIYVVPFTAMALILLIVSNQMLRITGPMHWISVATGLLITWTIVAMALGFGAIYADFTIENRAAMLGGFGAVLFLFSAIGFELLLILLGSLPAYRLMQAWFRSATLLPGDLLIPAIALAGMLLLCLGIALTCLFLGGRHLET